MEQSTDRTLSPHFLRNVLNVVAVEGGVASSLQQLVTGLMAEMKIEKESEAKAMVNMAVEEGFLILTNKKRRKSSLLQSSADGIPAFIPFYRLPKDSEIKKIVKMDPYCFECHLPKHVAKCKNCKRSFHEDCVRSHPEKPLYEPPSGKKQKNRPPAYHSEDECNDYSGYTNNQRSLSSLTNPDESVLNEQENVSQNENVNENPTPIPISNPTPNPNDNNDKQNENQNENAESEAIASHGVENVEQNTLVVSSTLDEIITMDNEDDAMEHKPKIENIKPEFSIANETLRDVPEIKSDVLYIGQVRKPSRRRQTDVKMENDFNHNETVSEDNEKELCTCCRLMANADIRNPPNREADEISHLLNFTFQTNHSWLSYDVKRFIEKDKATSEKVKELCNLLFLHPFMSLDFIEHGLKEKKYESLNQFLVDILDLQHVMGVFFGDQSCEYEQTKWLVRDIQHDIAEIRRCPDCFRYSNEKICDLWFALPCVQRHELVFAKQSGFPYWPAKVIRVLANGKHDVRFFGPYHSRALVNQRFIKPLDTPIKSLKMGNSIAVRKAMDELRYHTDLKVRFTPDQFAFKSDPDSVKKIVNNLTEQYRLNVNVLPPLLTIIPSQIDESLSVVHTLEAREGFSQANTNANGMQNVRKRRNTDGKCYIIKPIDTRIICLDGTQTAKRRTLNSNDNNQIAAEGPSTSAEAASSHKSSRIAISINSANSTSSISTIATNVPTRKISDVQAALEQLKQMKRALAAANADVASLQKRLEKRGKVMQKMKSKIQTLEVLVEVNKKKQWCQWCYKEAKYLCCFTGTYCSAACQSLHWDAGHEKTCKTNDP